MPNFIANKQYKFPPKLLFHSTENGEIPFDWVLSLSLIHDAPRLSLQSAVEEEVRLSLHPDFILAIWHCLLVAKPLHQVCCLWAGWLHRLHQTVQHATKEYNSHALFSFVEINFDRQLQTWIIYNFMIPFDKLFVNPSYSIHVDLNVQTPFCCYPFRIHSISRVLHCGSLSP